MRSDVVVKKLEGIRCRYIYAIEVIYAIVLFGNQWIYGISLKKKPEDMWRISPYIFHYTSHECMTPRAWIWEHEGVQFKRKRKSRNIQNYSQQMDF